ncbi:hypothetical protein AB0L00_35540 [Actinoallomurus sp. NPDC052308]|uniref:hypothetical protein n=1 Tax=Actinoallomurus sp. NPDC052308 TaxID=3155530 RepID=UPI00342CFB85
MRYLADSFALGALQRGKAIAQFLGSSRAEERRVVISWVEVHPVRDGFAVVLHVAEDVGGEHFADLWEFLPADPDDEFGRQIGQADDAGAAMSLAEELTSAVRGHWVNLGVVQDEYLDYVRGERGVSR